MDALDEAHQRVVLLDMLSKSLQLQIQNVHIPMTSREEKDIVNTITDLVAERDKRRNNTYTHKSGWWHVSKGYQLDRSFVEAHQTWPLEEDPIITARDPEGDVCGDSGEHSERVRK
ncbi:uncharacterized protein BDR25DRAFT_314567 [Lindgomyces ingoldianus]|uniref:Uncharacterized protein n=1 Tax=Lindgomyces ingoldianus TaxID=673940 RepID=A0ACB6QWA5_9PLEO|nr:uncharacterized protein BDR25DRAFT_314567 [Lindgomyces ingoldianus]KAF2470347.1 hypothetical protein BDR25DRAFT_314567 [Lindgomyces ingoldianus]